MLDTQVYSNTGGQNSDSTPMLGGGDMNRVRRRQPGQVHREEDGGRDVPRGDTARPSSAQVSIANAPKLFRAILDALEYRGTAFLQCFTTCQPEHGVGDDMGARSGAARPRLAGRAGVRLQSAAGRDLPGGARPEGEPQREGRLVTRRGFKATGERYRYNRRALVRHRGAVPQPPEEGLRGAGRAARSAGEHAAAADAERRGLPPATSIRNTAPTCRTSASTSRRFRRRATSRS